MQSLLLSRTTRFSALKDKTIWVTGASSGIGAELVCQLVHAEARHVILSSRRHERLTQVAQTCSQEAPGSPTVLSVLPYDAEATDARITEATVTKAIEMSGKSIDMIFLNAGMYQVKPALQSNIEDTRQIMRVNYESPVELVLTLMRLNGWKERGYGHIVVTASLVSHGGHSLASTYSASKHALRGFFQSLSAEEFQWLRVDFVCPGAVKTNIWNALGNDTVVADDSAKLEVERFVQLMLTGVVGPWVFFHETWISKAPGLMWITLAAYSPLLFHFAIHAFGFARFTVWENSGQLTDSLNLPELVKALWTTGF